MSKKSQLNRTHFYRHYALGAVVVALASAGGAACGPLSPSVAKSSLNNIAKNFTTSSKGANTSFQDRCDLEKQSVVGVNCAATVLSQKLKSSPHLVLDSKGENSTKFEGFKKQGRVKIAAKDVPVADEGIQVLRDEEGGDETRVKVEPQYRAYIEVDVSSSEEGQFSADQVKVTVSLQSNGALHIEMPALSPDSKATESEKRTCRFALDHLSKVTIVSN